MDFILQTERLKLREFNRQDTGFILKLLNTKGWLDFIGVRNVHDVQGAIAYLEGGPIHSYKQHGFGIYLVELKDGSVPIGMCSILKRDTLLDPDIGFAFLPEYEGQGYATESTKAILTYASQHLRVPRVCAITKADNKKSIRVLESVGLKFIRRISFSEANEGLLLYGKE